MTLIELMIGLVLASLLVALVLGIHTRMATAFRRQMVISEVHQTLRGARDAAARDLRQAGYRITRMRVGTGAFGSDPFTDIPALVIENGAGGLGSDVIHAFYAGGDGIANVEVMAPDRGSATVDGVDAFEVGQVVVLSAPVVVTPPGTLSYVDHEACVVRITRIEAGAPIVYFAADATGAPYNTTGNQHCEVVRGRVASGNVVMAPLIARAYRVDPNRTEVGVLQLSLSGGLVAGDWQDVAVGVVDLQIASRWREPGDAADLDLDGDAELDWYSGDGQAWPDTASARPANAIPRQLSLAMVARSPNEISGVGSATTPHLTDDANPENNELGDAPGVDVPPTHVYRSARELIDLRNMGFGQ